MNILSEIIRGVWLMDASYAEQYYPIALKLLTGDIQPAAGGYKEIQFFDEESKFAVVNDGQICMMSVSDVPNVTNLKDLFWNHDMIMENSIFMLDVNGPITKYDQFCGQSGMRSKSAWIKMADDNPNIIAHVLRIDSGGGEAYAARLFSETVKSLKKPVFAFVEGLAASAAYWIASASKFIVLSSDMDRVGSIGTYVTIADFQKYYKKLGVTIKDVYATKSKDKNSDYIQAVAGNDEQLRKVVDRFNEFFLSSIQTYRSDSLKSEESVWGTGKVFFAHDAIKNGLADEIDTLDNLLLSIYNTFKK